MRQRPARVVPRAAGGSCWGLYRSPHRSQVHGRPAFLAFCRAAAVLALLDLAPRARITARIWAGVGCFMWSAYVSSAMCKLDLSRSISLFGENRDSRAWQASRARLARGHMMLFRPMFRSCWQSCRR